MKRTTLFIDPQLERELQAIARREGRPMSTLVREAVAEYVANARQRRGPRLGFIAAGRSGRRDVADRHEALLFEQDLPETRPQSTPPPRRRTPARRRQSR